MIGQSFFRRRILVPLFLAAVALAPMQASGQSADQMRFGVLVVLVDRLPGNAGASDAAVVLRRPGESPREVILLPAASADGEALASAVFKLLLTRQVEGVEPRGRSSLRVPDRTIPAAWQNTDLPRAERFVQRLRSANVQPVRGVGMARSLPLFLPHRPIIGLQPKDSGNPPRR
jgi:hypothetical protein